MKMSCSNLCLVLHIGFTAYGEAEKKHNKCIILCVNLSSVGRGRRGCGGGVVGARYCHG